MLGAGGVLGGAICDRLERLGWDVVRAVRRCTRTGSGRLRSGQWELALDDERELPRALREHDLVVSCVREPRLTPERIALASGGTVLSVASLTSADRRSLEQAPKCRAGLVIVHAGLNPGLSSILAADLLERHPEADGLELVLTLSSHGSGGAHGMTTIAIPLLKRVPIHPTATVSAPEPYGTRRCMAVGDGSEGFFGVVGERLRRRVYWSFRERSTHRLLLALNAARVLPLIPDALLLAGHRRPPSALSREPKRDVVAVTLGGRRLAAYAIEGEGDYAMTATVSAAFAECAVRRHWQPPLSGCHGAEELFAAEELLPRLRAEGVLVSEVPVP